VLKFNLHLNQRSK